MVLQWQPNDSWWQDCNTGHVSNRASIVHTGEMELKFGCRARRPQTAERNMIRRNSVAEYKQESGED